MKKTAILFTTLSVFTFCGIASPLQPDDLRCEYLQNPLGIDVNAPRFSWTFAASGRNQLQSAYEIIVSDNATDILRGIGNAWSTGKILSDQNTQVAYQGLPLAAFTRYYWRVRTYNNTDEASAWSPVNWFETAMLRDSDWNGKWIGDGSGQPQHDEDFYKDDRMPLFRKSFSAEKKIASARLYISGLGYYEAYLNGERIGDHVLDPGFTTFRKQVLYATYDITQQLRRGTNVIGFMLGNGWYNPLPMRLFGRFNLRDVQQNGRPCVKAEIHIRYADGSTSVIVTDTKWQTAPGPIVRNNVYLGEQYDARLEQENWCSNGTVSTDWKDAAIVGGPDGQLTAQMQPPIRITRVLKPVRITEAGKDTFIVDMGQNFAGVARIRVKAPAGTRISLRYGEILFKDGRLNYFTTVAGQIKDLWHISGGSGAPRTAWQQDEYIAKGDGAETWSPRFTFHGFRYVEITGWNGVPTVNDIEGLRMNSDVESVGSFSCSNPMLNRLHDAVQWTLLSNIFSVESDCPGREKMGYGADMVVASNTYAYNYDMSNFYTKAVRDFANEQLPDGGITEIAPSTGIADRGYGGQSGPIGWELAFPYLQELLYASYGDTRVIENNYERVKKQIAFLQSKAVNNLFYWGISDHEALDPKPESFSVSAFYYHHVKLAEKFAGILHQTADSARFDSLAKRIRAAIIAEYHIPNTGRFDNATESAQIFALWYGFAEDKDPAMKVLMQEFERHNMHLSTGIFSTRMMFEVLRAMNMNEVAYQIATQTDFPGWGYMLENGATTIWESWAYSDNAASHNHPMFGSVDEWFYRSLLGINAGAPGFRKIIISPQPVKGLTSAKGYYRSIQGKIVSEWTVHDGTINLHVTIPANTTAEIHIPAKAGATVRESGTPINTHTDMSLIGFSNGAAVINTGSGDYDFTSDVDY